MHRSAWEGFSDEMCGKLLKYLIKYQFDGEMPENLPPDLIVAINFLKPVIDKQKEEYKFKCLKNKQIADSRWDNNKKNQ